MRLVLLVNRLVRSDVACSNWPPRRASVASSRLPSWPEETSSLLVRDCVTSATRVVTTPAVASMFSLMRRANRFKLVVDVQRGLLQAAIELHGGVLEPVSEAASGALQNLDHAVAGRAQLVHEFAGDRNEAVSDNAAGVLDRCREGETLNCIWWLTISEVSLRCEAMVPLVATWMSLTLAPVD